MTYHIAYLFSLLLCYMDDSMADPALPVAHKRKKNTFSWIWLVPILALLGAATLIYQSFYQQRGIEITLKFQQGYGLKVGDAVLYRGIEVGRVETVQLSHSLQQIEVTINLRRTAKELARAKSRFWIVRPQFDITGAQGLDTLIGANYITVLPGEGDYATHFTGLDTPPLLELMEAGGVEIQLRAEGRGSLQRGAPVMYRQVVIGTILNVELTQDANAVAAHVYINPRYTSLIRENTRFWKVSGANLDVGLTGLSFHIDSVKTLVAGGITLAIPPTAGAIVSTGHHFTLYDEPERNWLTWRPNLLVDKTLYALEHPQVYNAHMSWENEGYLKMLSHTEHTTWSLPVKTGLIAPLNLFSYPDSAKPSSIYLAFAEERIFVDKIPRVFKNGLALYPHEHNLPSQYTQRTPSEAEDVIIITDKEHKRIIKKQFITVTDKQLWAVTGDHPFKETWHGAVVMAAKDSALLGLLLVDDDKNYIALLPDLSTLKPEVTQ